jgi:hypothetical protein
MTIRTTMPQLQYSELAISESPCLVRSRKLIRFLGLFTVMLPGLAGFCMTVAKVDPGFKDDFSHAVFWGPVALGVTAILMFLGYLTAFLAEKCLQMALWSIVNKSNEAKRDY